MNTTRERPEAAGIEHGKEVISSCGCRLGTVDGVEDGGVIKLTRRDSGDGRHHFVPQAWVARVDEHVHLNKDMGETRRAWETDFAAAR